MTRDEATARAEALQTAHPEAKWLATRRDDGWAVVRIDVQPGTNEPTGTTLKPEPAAPRDDPYSELDRVDPQLRVTPGATAELQEPAVAAPRAIMHGRPTSPPA
jgi:hypothetical protein